MVCKISGLCIYFNNIKIMKTNIIIHINEYGPIKDAEIKFYPMLIFIGNSNLGKSYVNYLFYFLMQSLTWNMFQDIAENIFSRHKLDDGDFSFSLTENDLRKWLVEHVQAYLASFLGDQSLQCSVSFSLGLDEVLPNGKIKVFYHREFVKGSEENPFDTISTIVNINGEVSSTRFYVNGSGQEKQHLGHLISTYVQKLLFGYVVPKSVILPPARGSYVGENFSAKEMIASQAGMYRLFLGDYDFALHGMEGDTRDEQFFIERVKTLVKGNLITEDNKQYLMLSNGRKLPLTAAASSIKELSPLLFYLKNWAQFRFSFCIEEPEAHLHPLMQMDVADLLAACVNKGMFVQLTTHSDYFLQRINQLIRLGNLRKNNNAEYEAFRKKHELNARFYLESENVACYYFHSEGDRVVISKLENDDNGLPLATFFDAVRKLTDFDDELAIALNPQRYADD